MPMLKAMQNQINSLAAHLPAVGHELNKVNLRLDKVVGTVADHTERFEQLDSGAPAQCNLIGWKVAKINGSSLQSALTYSMGEIVVSEPSGRETLFTIKWESGETERVPWLVVSGYLTSYNTMPQVVVDTPHLAPPLSPVVVSTAPGVSTMSPPVEVVGTQSVELRHLLMGNDYKSFVGLKLPKGKYQPLKKTDRKPGQVPVAETVKTYLERSFAQNKKSTGINFPVINVSRGGYEVTGSSSIEENGWTLVIDTKSPGSRLSTNKISTFLDGRDSTRRDFSTQPQSLVDNRGYLTQARANIEQLDASNYPGVIMLDHENVTAFADRLEKWAIRLGGVDGDGACGHVYGNCIVTVALLRAGILPARICPTIGRSPVTNTKAFDDFVVLDNAPSQRGHVIQVKLTFQDNGRGKKFSVATHQKALLHTDSESTLPPYDLVFVLTWLPRRNAVAGDDDRSKKRRSIGQALITPPPRKQKK
jgi:hypothetical protein